MRIHTQFERIGISVALALLIGPLGGCSGGTHTRRPPEADSSSQPGPDSSHQPNPDAAGDSQATGADSCAQVVSCWQPCADAGCIQSCNAQGNPSARQELAAVESCLSGAVNGTCASQCTNTSDLTACDTCLAQSCATELDSCGVTLAQYIVDKTGTTGDLSCTQVVSCWDGCSDYICANDCYYKGTATAQQQVDAIDACTGPAEADQCATECANTNDYTACDSCLDQICTDPLSACGVTAAQYFGD